MVALFRILVALDRITPRYNTERSMVCLIPQKYPQKEISLNSKINNNRRIITPKTPEYSGWGPERAMLLIYNLDMDRPS